MMDGITDQLAKTKLDTKAKEWSNVIQLTKDIEQNVLNQYVEDLQDLFTEANTYDGINHSYRYHLPSIAEYDRLKSDMIFVALNQGKVIGLMVGFDDDDEIDVTSIVHPKFRRQGVFRALLNALKPLVGESKQLVFEVCAQSTSGVGCAKHLGLESDAPKIDCYMACKELKPTNKTLPNITFKLATEADAHLIALILEEDAKFNEEEFNAERAIEDFKEDLTKELEYRVYFDEEKELVGMVEYVSRNDLDPPYIMNFFVRPKYRGKSYGEAILRNIVSYWLCERKRSPVELETPREIAFKLYTKCGFDVVQSYNRWRA